MRQKFKILLFVLLFAMIWLPFFQEQTKLFTEPKLTGVFIEPAKPEFSLDSLNELRFQKKFENYQNYKFGFKGLLVKIKNSINYVLFKELSVTDNIAGKDNFIFSVGSAERTLGIRYNGKEQNNSTVEKINFLKQGLESHGGRLAVLFVPSKEMIMPDFLPTIYKGKGKSETDYRDLIEGYKKYNIPVLDYCEYFEKLNAVSQYPLYTKSGVHWSIYGASIAQDTLVHYIENLLGKTLPGYKWTGIELSDTARESDNDFEAPLNLFCDLGQSQYAYPKMEMISSTQNNYKPKVIIIGDSFFWQIKMRRILMHVFSTDSKFWYYFSRSCPIGDEAGCPIDKIDILKELKTADLVLLMGNIGTLDRFPFGVTDYYYDNIAKPEAMEFVKQYLQTNSIWIAHFNARSSADKVPVSDLVTREAKRICRDEKRVIIQAANGKQVSSDGDHNNTIAAGSDHDWLWETFSLLYLKNDQVAIYSYRKKFLSAGGDGKTEITALKDAIGEQEIFTIEKLSANTFAFKAANGKYLSLDERSKRLFANSPAIGKNEKFKLRESAY